ncbi:MAG: YfhO family protein, partial [Bacteroidetes bacterium]|nr:YfhO family protein [Bacteroidota bacterium]
ADNADQEIAALDKIDPGKEIVVNKKFQSLLESVTPGTDVTSKLALKSYSPNQLVYSYSGKGKEIAVFSEIYYPKGWNAYIGDQLVPYFQANYVLRAMVLPEGTYDITFKFEPLSYRLGKQISMVSSLLLLLFIGFVLYKNITLKNSSK